MTKLVEAFLKWKNSPLRECCGDMENPKTHWGRKRVPYEKYKEDGTIIQGERNEDFQLSDKECCERERLWREYCSIRDGVNYHIEPLK
jgi:hypothetical protein